MASVAEARRSPFTGDRNPNMHRSIPILPSSASSSLAPPRDPMDLTPASTSAMGPPTLTVSSADRDRLLTPTHQTHPQPQSQNSDSDAHAPTSTSTANTNANANGSSAPAVGAAAAAQQPKVVQTAFIHKLYNMLEDPSIQHLISWSSTNESFVMSPSSEFSKVLSSYFKHTNISSFVRQLNMYGFHKVSDVFHTGSPDSPLWEFKHGNGNFKRGDLVGLREIKRRASRHALIHRDSFSTPKLPTGPPPAQPIEQMPDPVESRLNALEYNLHNMHSQIQRSEDTCAYLSQKAAVLMEGMMRCHQWNQELTHHIMDLVPDPEHAVHKNIAVMARDISRYTEMLRTIDQPEEPVSARSAYFMQVDSNGPPLSPRAMPHDQYPDSRRGSLAGLPRQTPVKPPVPAHLTISPRRYGSIGTGHYSPSPARPPAAHQPPPPPPPPPPSIQAPGGNGGNNASSGASPPYNQFQRRHTSADIRTVGWQPQPPPTHSPYASGHNSTQWPSSPHRAPIGGGDEQLRNALESYQLPRGPRGRTSRQGTPPDGPPSSLNPDSGWTLPGARYPFKGFDTPGPPTRRSSMASNVHSLLNPAETAERADEDEPEDPRKRKRMQ
ncbi:Flocculation suppression protein [Ascochyta clinopodiicola]|nr:Flocculation suppression protein [Ascochyta clinopodiicola]